LQLLNPDMDYRSLLPPGTVSKGDAWTIGADDLLQALAPGMDLRSAAASGLEINGKAIPPAGISLLDKVLKTSEVSGKYAGVAEVDGVEVAQIDITGKLAGTTGFDPSDFIDSVEGTVLEPGSWVTLVLDLKLDGTLSWDVGAGHFASFELKSDGAVHMSMAVSMGDFDVEFALAAALGLKQEATAADVE
jgi:hypothetical protein